MELQVAGAALYGISVAILLFTQRRRAPESLSEVFSGQDCRLDASASEPAADPGGLHDRAGRAQLAPVDVALGCDPQRRGMTERPD